MWDDAIAQELSQDEWLERIKKFKPDLIMFESKTPVIKRHWKVIEVVKKELPNTKIVLVGDHVTALPEESMQKSPVDFVATGGDYDFLILNIADHINHGETSPLSFDVHAHSQQAALRAELLHLPPAPPPPDASLEVLAGLAAKSRFEPR